MMGLRKFDGTERRSVVVDVVVGALLGGFLLFLNHGTVMQLGTIDPWFYTGFIFGFEELAEAFGVTYYSLRVAFLLPALAFDGVFGMMGGYLLLRVGLVVVLVLSLARIARVFVSPLVARLLAVVMVLHPWVWRSLFSNYVDAIGPTHARRDPGLRRGADGGGRPENAYGLGRGGGFPGGDGP